MRRFLLLIVLLASLTRCSLPPLPAASGPPAIAAVTTASPAAPPAPSPTASASPAPLPPATATSAPTATPSPVPTVAPSPTATPDPLAPFFIETLRARTFGMEGAIAVGPVLAEDEAYTRYAIRYPSDGLTISGYLDLPRGQGPFPVIILNHGYYDPVRYRSGDGTAFVSDSLARRGYLTIAPDYRVYGDSDDGNNDFRVGYVVDVVTLVNLLPTLPSDWADPTRVGMWGHSMGGGITLNAVVISERIKAAVVYGGVSGDMAQYWNHVHAMWQRDEMNRAAERFGTPTERPDGYAKMSALNYVEHIRAAISIHHGTADEQVPYAWSEALHDRLRATGKEVEYFAYPQARHTFTGADHALFLDRVAAFFDRHLGEAPSAD